LRIRKTIGVLALAGTTLLGLAAAGGDDSGSERAVEWRVDRPVGPDWVRLSASIEVYSIDLPLLEEPIIEYKGNRVYIEPHCNRDGPSSGDGRRTAGESSWALRRGEDLTQFEFGHTGKVSWYRTHQEARVATTGRS
jgi:hypothetical protein